MKYPKAPKEILPALIIGLGGTGYQVIKRLKKLFSKRYNNEKLPVRYLLIDTDLKTFLDDSIKNSEKCQLKFGEGIKNTLDWAYNNPNFDWLPQNPKITPDFFTSTDQGAGLVRPIGRMYLYKNAKLVYDCLQTAKNDLADLHKLLTENEEINLENIDRHKVYIVGSLAGGTGCGTFLDVAVMISKIFNRDTTNIIGIFTLESCYDEKLSSDLDAQNRSKANCYAALKELEFYMSSITNPSDSKYTFKYSNVGKIKLDRKLLDICYLIENRNESGGVLTNIEDIYDLCSLQLFQEVGTALGSQLRADYANFICKDKDPVLKKDRHFSTFASSSMEFPAENLKKYCSLMLAKELLNKMRNDIRIEEKILNEEIDPLIKKINCMLEIDEICENFAFRSKIGSNPTVNELISKKNNLMRVENDAREKENRWKQSKERAREDIKNIMRDYINETTVRYGIKFVMRVLEEVKTRFTNELEEVNYTGSLDRSSIEAAINELNSKIKENKRTRETKQKQAVEITTKFNLLIDQMQNKIMKMVYSDRLEAVMENIKNINDRFDILVSHIGDMINEIDVRIKKISDQSEKKYGGNIVSREMISRKFYDRYYNSNFSYNFMNRVKSMFVDKNLIEVIESGSEELINLCNDEYEKVEGNKNLNIIEVLKENAKEKNEDFESYMRKELNITSKLANPFWSAVKNPEVSWTECFYIGCIRDESINNGFTIKPPAAIDSWIRNQTGERSRWARYVETRNPYSIDVIHITMGACAAYLPDIKNYKACYMKLLASETYPLHLHQDYIGLEELDQDMEEMLKYYSLAKAFGVILQAGGTSYLNIIREGNGFKYINKVDNCLDYKEYFMDKPEDEGDEVSKKVSMRILGNSYSETIRKISENNEISLLIREFIKDAEGNFSKEELKKHCEMYLKNKVSGNSDKDFIAEQKIDQRFIAN
ncbi:tubulin-like doman-containing protein [Clostridium thermarum]|uniref:tubulin-like doman-containing protein n=1 Tax=Clostridium thermarum TaxID=1716543 RepID=UPI00111E1AA7|nr:tubulin-like doman-containing protein [Clostridium thermarum]